MIYTWKDVGPAVGGKVIAQADRQKIADEWNAYELEKPLIDWKRKMAKSDAILRGRVVEELLDFVLNGAPLSQFTKDKLAERKALRASKP